MVLILSLEIQRVGESVLKLAHVVQQHLTKTLYVVFFLNFQAYHIIL